MTDDSDYEVGYKKPPKKTQFKKGTSGCLDGGHAQRRANKQAREEAAADKQRKKNKELENIVQNILREEREVITPDGPRRMPNVEILIRNMVGRSLKPDASPRDVSAAVKLAKEAKMLEPPSAKPRASVLVVNQIMEPDAWARATEGELLPRNPLEGLPGAEHVLDATPRRQTDTRD